MIRVYLSRPINQLGNRSPEIDFEPIGGGGDFPIETTFPTAPIEIQPATTAQTPILQTAAPIQIVTPPRTTADAPMTTGAIQPTTATTTAATTAADAETIDWIDWAKQNPLFIIAGVGAIVVAANYLKK